MNKDPFPKASKERQEEFLKALLEEVAQAIREQTDDFWTIEKVKFAINDLESLNDELFKSVLGVDLMTELQSIFEEEKTEDERQKALEEVKDKFVPMLQGVGTNKLIQLNARKARPTMTEATITDEEYNVFIKKYSEHAGGLRTSVKKLLDVCAIELTKIGGYRENKGVTDINISLEGYMRMRGIAITKPSKDKMRRSVKEDLETLYDISIEWQEGKGDNVKDYKKMRIVIGHSIKNGVINIELHPRFAKYLSGAYVMQYPVEILKLKNPNSYYLGRKLLLHRSIDKNQERGTGNIISVKALLAACPDILTYEEVIKSSNRSIERRIRTPLENALDELQNDILSTWEYSNSRGVRLTDEQTKSASWSVFSRFYVKFEIKDFPDQTPRLEAKEEAKKVAVKKAKAAKERAIKSNAEKKQS